MREGNLFQNNLLTLQCVVSRLQNSEPRFSRQLRK
jgi:hypothetical protein